MGSDKIHTLCKLVSCASAKKYNLMPQIMNQLKSEKINPDKIYESILQLYLFNGFPVTIETLKIFYNNYPDYKPVYEQYNVNLFEKRGISNCKTVYGKNYDKLQSNISSMSDDLSDWMIIEGYGKVLGRPGLSLQEREILNLAMLCTNYSEHQLHSHIRGSLNTGSDLNLIETIIQSTSEYNSNDNIINSLELVKSIKSSVT